MGGIGSGRMKIARVSDEFNKYLNPDHYVSNANIELRPKGILIHFRHKLQAYTWVMPYEGLVINNEETLFIQYQDKFILFKEQLSPAFLKKLLKVKNESK